jgi:hypothetical protein
MLKIFYNKDSHLLYAEFELRSHSWMEWVYVLSKYSHSGLHSLTRSSYCVLLSPQSRGAVWEVTMGSSMASGAWARILQTIPAGPRTPTILYHHSVTVLFDNWYVSIKDAFCPPISPWRCQICPSVGSWHENLLEVKLTAGIAQHILLGVSWSFLISYIDLQTAKTAADARTRLV